MKFKPQDVANALTDNLKYIAKDSGGLWCAYEYKPQRSLECWVERHTCTILHIDIEYDGDWKDSLFVKKSPLNSQEDFNRFGVELNEKKITEAIKKINRLSTRLRELEERVEGLGYDKSSEVKNLENKVEYCEKCGVIKNEI